MYKHKYNLVLIPFFLLLMSSFLMSQDKEQIYNEIIKKYGSATSISLQFKSMDNPNIEGSIEAKTGNKYIIRMGNRIITCNGTAIWNYSIQDKNVIISRFDKDLHSNSIEKMFFSLLQTFNPISLKKESSTRGTSFSILELENSEQSDFADIQSIRLWLDRNNNIDSFALSRNGSIEKWAIWGIVTNKKIPNTQFNFSVPKGTEVIDLR